MPFESVFASIARVIEGIGIVIMAVGLVVVLARFGYQVLGHHAPPVGYGQLRASMGRVILVGLEILIVGDIVRTVIVEASLTGVAVLGVIVLIRTVLSFTPEVELTGQWPWRQHRNAADERRQGPDA